jgi:hypothetical protein
MFARLARIRQSVKLHCGNSRTPPDAADRAARCHVAGPDMTLICISWPGMGGLA